MYEVNDAMKVMVRGRAQGMPLLSSQAASQAGSRQYRARLSNLSLARSDTRESEKNLTCYDGKRTRKKDEGSTWPAPSR